MTEVTTPGPEAALLAREARRSRPNDHDTMTLAMTRWREQRQVVAGIVARVPLVPRALKAQCRPLMELMELAARLDKLFEAPPGEVE